MQFGSAIADHENTFGVPPDGNARQTPSTDQKCHKPCKLVGTLLVMKQAG